MPPARPRNLDDSRSDASSIVTNLKDKSLLGPTSGSGVSKNKRPAPNTSAANGSTKAVLNGSAPAGVEAERDPNLPRTDWATMPVPFLRTYRIAHRLSVASAFNHPHAELTYTSSDLALRTPSAVYARRKLHEQKQQRRKLQQTQQNGSKNTKSKDKSKDNVPTSTSVAQSVEAHDHNSELGVDAPTATSTYLGRREPASHLVNAVRKHFNAQQLSEADTIARFIYVVQQNGKTVRTEGSAGDGRGYWMGSHGRQIRKIDGPGGEVGFRLRFRP
ncbi:hypothetical protein PV11_00090 [Exophiala sideris]|uniref:Histone deacetylase complex subunit SAP30 Sin3 binding domain-containing protein n=1 Tax=Exophiala sideris TaxID=1016849 RepID=A0A0D1YN05_9EURO|nr:hypothetical protein PV11_00090 [Exophiala sideris]